MADGRVLPRAEWRSMLLLRLVVALAYGGLLTVLAVAPALPDAGPSPSDKLVHGVAYGLQALLLAWAIGDTLPRPRAALLAWLGATVIGLATEVLQIFQPHRSAQLGDLVADSAGAAFLMSALLVAHACSVSLAAAPARRTDR